MWKCYDDSNEQFMCMWHSVDELAADNLICCGKDFSTFENKNSENAAFTIRNLMVFRFCCNDLW